MNRRGATGRTAALAAGALRLRGRPLPWGSLVDGRRLRNRLRLQPRDVSSGLGNHRLRLQRAQWSLDYGWVHYRFGDRQDRRRDHNGNWHDRSSRNWSRRSCGQGCRCRRVQRLGRCHGNRRLDFRMRDGCLGLEGRGRLLGWHDEVLAGGGLQRDRGADADRQRDLQRHHRANTGHRQPAAEQQDRPATRLAGIQTDEVGRVYDDG